MSNVWRVAVFVFLLGCIVSASLFAQSDLGTISGFIKDPSGATIANARVLVHNQTGIQREAIANESGFYTVTNLPPGLYTIAVQAPGFQNYQSIYNKLEPTVHLSIDVEYTEEIQILTANYLPEYGRTSGGQIRIITRTGTQDFHGAAYEYLRNDAFNANTWTRNHTPGQNFVPPFRYNQFGYHLSGPLYIPGKFNTSKTKIFWYWGQESVRFRFTDTRSLPVPPLLIRQGDSTDTLNPNNLYFSQASTS